MSKVILLCKTTLLKHGWEADDETLDKACQDLSLDDQDSWASMTTLEVRLSAFELLQKPITWRRIVIFSSFDI